MHMLEVNTWLLRLFSCCWCQRKGCAGSRNNMFLKFATTTSAETSTLSTHFGSNWQLCPPPLRCCNLTVQLCTLFHNLSPYVQCLLVILCQSPVCKKRRLRLRVPRVD